MENVDHDAFAAGRKSGRLFVEMSYMAMVAPQSWNLLGMSIRTLLHCSRVRHKAHIDGGKFRQ